jgi:hypothetical protein
MCDAAGAAANATTHAQGTVTVHGPLCVWQAGHAIAQVTLATSRTPPAYFADVLSMSLTSPTPTTIDGRQAAWTESDQLLVLGTRVAFVVFVSVPPDTTSQDARTVETAIASAVLKAGA